MALDMDFFRPIISGLAGGFVVYLMARSARKPAKRVKGRTTLTYSTGFRIFAAVLVPGSLFVAYAASQARPSQVVIAAVIAVAFLAAAAFFAYQAFFVHFAYDDDNIYYRSPFAGSKTIPWSEVREVSYSSLMQAHFIRTSSVSRIWCSNMLIGYEELGGFLARRLGGSDQEQS